MYSLETICHENIEHSRLLDVIKMKSSVWDYPLESQIQWMYENIAPSDIHCILKDDGIDVAYLNLVNIALDIDGARYSGFGVGNVCSLVKSKGYGSVLMEMTNLYIKQQTRIGMLFCKSSLLAFYSRFDWKRILRDHLLLPSGICGIEVMLYNFPNEFGKLKYGGTFF